MRAPSRASSCRRGWRTRTPTPDASTSSCPPDARSTFFSEHIGPYSYEKLANVAAAGINGGTEHASAIFYGEKGVTPAPATGLVVHETAHQWFGDSITEKDWDDVWLSEGFATYFTLLYTEHYEGRDAFVAGLKASRARVLALQKSLPGVAVLHDNLSDMSQVLNQLIYQKGGWTLHMLRGVIGTDTFWAGIREYYRRYRNASASTADFRRVMEQRVRPGPRLVLRRMADALDRAVLRRKLALRRREQAHRDHPGRNTGRRAVLHADRDWRHRGRAARPVHARRAPRADGRAQHVHDRARTSSRPT